MTAYVNALQLRELADAMNALPAEVQTADLEIGEGRLMVWRGDDDEAMCRVMDATENEATG